MIQTGAICVQTKELAMSVFDSDDYDPDTGGLLGNLVARSRGGGLLSRFSQSNPASDVARASFEPFSVLGYGGFFPGSYAAIDGAPLGGLFPGPNSSLRSPSGSFAAIGRDAPVVNVPLTQTSPFNFDRYFGDMQSRYLWNKLLFEPTPLPANPFFWGTYLNPEKPPAELFDPRPMNPPEGVPLVPPHFR
jgi:hypothetical protein